MIYNLIDGAFVLVSSSKFPNWDSLYQSQFKNVCSLDKVALQEVKICSQIAAEKSLRGNRIRSIQQELVDLSDDPKLFDHLASCHYLFFLRICHEVKYESFSCAESSFAMIHLNIFKQKLFRLIHNFEVFKQELQDGEEGAFLVDMPGTEYSSDSGEQQIFQGHAFIIFKMIEGDKASYLVAQSFVERYSLKSFISKNEMIYGSYAQLNEKVLKPLNHLLEKNGKWTDRECQAHLDLTSIYPSRLIGYSHPKLSLLKSSGFARTSNVEVEGADSLSLMISKDGKYSFPSEWKQMIKDAESSAGRE